MSRFAFSIAAVVLVAGCGGSKHAVSPTTALLTGVHLDGKSVTFDFKSAPRAVQASYEPRTRIVESGSGAPVRLKGKAYVVIRFTPAASADLEGAQGRSTYTGPRRLSGPGPLLEAVETDDFESVLSWAIGLDRRLPLRVAQHGSTVIASFG